MLMSSKPNNKKGLQPKLRFPEFRDAKVWEKQPLEKFLDYQQPTPYLVADTNYSNDYETPVLTAGKTFLLGYTNERNGIFEDDLPVIIFDDFTTATQFVDFPFKAKSSAMKILQAKNGASIKFMYEAMQMISYEVGAHERHWISKFAPMQIPIPVDPKEQKKIADFLSSLDELITAEDQKLDALQQHKKGLMQELFPAEGKTLPKRRFPEFQNAPEWQIKPLGDFLLSKPEYGVNAAAVPYSPKLPTYLRITDISEDGRFLSEKKTSVAIEATDEHYLKDGDIVLARTGASVGKSYKFRREDGELIFAGFLIRVRVNPAKLDSTFLFNFLFTKQYWKWVGITSARSGQPGINGSEYASLIVPVPIAKEEQQRIANCLSSIDDLITTQSQKLGALRNHKNGLMQQLFPSVSEVQE